MRTSSLAWITILSFLGKSLVHSLEFSIRREEEEVFDEDDVSPESGESDEVFDFTVDANAIYDSLSGFFKTVSGFFSSNSNPVSSSNSVEGTTAGASQSYYDTMRNIGNYVTDTAMAFWNNLPTIQYPNNFGLSGDAMRGTKNPAVNVTDADNASTGGAFEYESDSDDPATGDVYDDSDVADGPLDATV